MASLWSLEAICSILADGKIEGRKVTPLLSILGLEVASLFLFTFHQWARATWLPWVQRDRGAAGVELLDSGHPTTWKDKDE